MQIYERDYKITSAQGHVIIKVEVLTLYPDLDGSAVSCGRAADTNALWMVASVPKRRAAPRANPAVSPRVSFGLLGQTLFKELHEFFPAMFFNGCLFLIAELALKILD